MRKYLILLFLLINLLTQAQPTITMADMPSVGDTLRTRTSIFGPGIDYQSAGPNFTWDFSSLTASINGADTFIAVSATPVIYQLVFNFPLDPNKANLASPQPDLTFIPNLPLTNIVDYYRKASASIGNCGFGATVAGIPLPIKFNSQDILYKFPLTASSTPDSTSVSFAQGISGLGYLSIQRKRVNIVDGWGTMITPAGSYSALRVKSTVQETDSIYIDSLSFGMAIPRNYIEYKWLANGKGIPVMMVSNENLIPAFTWIDSTAVASSFSVDLGQAQPICQGSSTTITATVSGGTPPYFYIWSNGGFGQTITVSPLSTTTYSVTVTDAALQFATASITIPVYPAPDATIIKDPDIPYGCNGIPFSTIFTFTAPAGYTMYSWSTGVSGPNLNSIIAGPPSIGYSGTVDYSVQVTDQHGCTGSDHDTVVWDVCEGVKELSTAPGFSVYPNPVNAWLRIEYSQTEALPLTLEIFDALGDKITSLSPENGNDTSGSLTLDLKSILKCNGLYFIRLSNDKGSKIKAVILE